LPYGKVYPLTNDSRAVRKSKYMAISHFSTLNALKPCVLVTLRTMVRYWTPTLPGLADAAAWSCKEVLKDASRSVTFKFVGPWTFANRVMFEESWYACFKKWNDLNDRTIDPEGIVKNVFIADEHTGRLERINLERNVMRLQEIMKDAEALGFDSQVEFKDHVICVNSVEGTVSLEPGRSFNYLPR